MKKIQFKALEKKYQTLEKMPQPASNKLPAWYSNANAKVRSATFQGIADAMGNQWGNESKLPTPIEQLSLLLTA